MANKKYATLTDCSVVCYPEIYDNIDNPRNVYAKFDGVQQVVLFGKAKNDLRHDTDTGAYADGHRLFTSPIIEVIDGKYRTANTIYVLDLDEQNKDYQEWCNNQVGQ